MYYIEYIHVLIVVSIYNTIPFEDKPLDFSSLVPLSYDLSRREGKD